MNINYSKFKNLFLRFIENKKNSYHPLVWINGNPKIGKNVYIGGFSEVNAKGSKITIGNNCDIASFVTINVSDSHLKTIKKNKNIIKKNIIIGDNVFIGSHSAILGGTKIKNNSVIAAGTVLRGENIPEYSLAIGNPAIIKKNYYKKK
jgi:acetyltransferase-like isoleucine patch superfamily enzyme